MTNWWNVNRLPRSQTKPYSNTRAIFLWVSVVSMAWFFRECHEGSTLKLTLHIVGWRKNRKTTVNAENVFHEVANISLNLISPMQPVQKKVEAAARSSIEKEGLVPHPSWRLKVLQLYETTLVRHGVMMVGPPGAGKSSTISTLQVTER